jgi:pentatricopeptide repeat protein
MALPEKTGHPTTMTQWLLFWDHCLKEGEMGMIRQSLKTMTKAGCRPTNEAFRILIRSMFVFDAPFGDFVRVLIEAFRARLPYDESIPTLLYDGFRNLGRVDRAAQARRMYKEKYTEILAHGEHHKLISAEAEEGGLEAAISLCHVLETQGLQPDGQTLTAALRHATSLADMRHAEDALGVQANVAHWSILIANSARLGDLRGALYIYEQSQELGIRPEVDMVYPIVHALCYPPLVQPTEAAIDRALNIYHHLFRVTSQPDSHTDSSNTRDDFGGPNAELYALLLHTLVSAANVQKYLPLAMALLKDMESRKVTPANSMAVASMTIVRMRSTSNYADAVDVFKRINSKNGHGLDAKGYLAILHAFCNVVSDGRENFPLVEHYFQIVEEMRRAQDCPTVNVYSILLRHIILAKDSRPDDIYFSVRAIHKHLVLDTSLSPNTALWNQLMDVYQRAGAFRDALIIWDTMFVSNQYDNTSVSIILDACAYAGSWTMATNICSRLFEAGFFFSQRNWNGWIECMCRLGKLDKAVKLVCMEMGKHQPNVAPDIESIRILLKFAKATNQRGDVRSHIKQYLPHLWGVVSRKTRD